MLLAFCFFFARTKMTADTVTVMTPARHKQRNATVPIIGAASETLTNESSFGSSLKSAVRLNHVTGRKVLGTFFVILKYGTDIKTRNLKINGIYSYAMSSMGSINKLICRRAFTFNGVAVR